MADMTAISPPGVLTSADVARIWTDELRKQYQQRVAARARENEARRQRGARQLPDLPAEVDPIKPATVLTYLRESQPTLTGSGRRRRYADRPMPAPAGRMGVMPWWPGDQEQALRDWFNSRAGRGHGTGGWPAGRPRSTGQAGS